MNSSALEPATQASVDAKTINTLIPQYHNYSTNSYKIIDLGNATLDMDMLNR